MPDNDDMMPEEGTVFISDKTLKRLVQANAEVTPPAHFLLLHRDDAPAQRIQLENLPLVIGRAEPAGLVLSSGTVSRRHCRLSLDGERVVLTDLGSTNGTFVNGARLEAEFGLDDGAQIAVGAFVLTYERRSRREADEALAQDQDMQQAVDYVMSILPPPIETGPIRTDWFYLPCTRLGGDSFGYQALDERHFSAFVVDVSGHGAGAALHSVTVANVLRQRMLPGVDFRDPAAVMGSLNRMFQMEHHNWLFFTIWYGVYDQETRKLRFCSAGHHPAVLARDGQRVEVGIRNPAIGLTPVHAYQGGEIEIQDASALYVFSDGVYEIEDRHGRQWEMDDFLRLLSDRPGPGEGRRLYDQVRASARAGTLDDDFSVMVLSFE